VNGEAKVQCRKGFFHRIEQEITSYFLKWFIYGQSLRGLVELGFGRVGEVYVHSEKTSRMSDIWMGTFNEGGIRKEKSDEAPESSKQGGRSTQSTGSFL
jgi:hypothetical protein